MKTKWIFGITLVVFVVASCSNDNELFQINIGENFIKSQSNVVIIDSMNVNLSTVIIDSVATSSTTQFLVGEYTDNLLGRISSTGFFQVDIPAYTAINEDAIFDSLTLVLNYSDLVYGDTLPKQILNVYRVTDDIEENDDGSLYNTSFFSYDENRLGSISFNPKPNLHDTLEIRLDDKLGQELVGLLKDEADQVSSSDDFVEYFKGLTVVPDENNSCILSFSSTDSLINFRLYTHYVAKEKVTVIYNFNMKSSSTCFSHISADRSGTWIENLKTQKEEMKSAESGNLTFIEGGLGIVTRVDFPGLGGLLELSYRKILYKAELILKPYPYGYKNSELPEKIEIYTTDKYNRLVEEITDSNDEPVYADFNLDDIYNENTYYKFDVTSYISDELSDGYFDSNSGLIITLPSEKLEGSLDRLAFDARKGISYQPKLNLYYVFYN